MSRRPLTLTADVMKGEVGISLYVAATLRRHLSWQRLPFYLELSRRTEPARLAAPSNFSMRSRQRIILAAAVFACNINQQEDHPMTKHISLKSGAPVGFHDAHAIYDLSGRIVGQLRGSRVYCMAGHHVGTLHNGILLSKSQNKNHKAQKTESAGASTRRP